MNRFERPIPGQSLTQEPKNAPYERPPEIVDPEQALQVHLARLNDVEAMDDAMFFLESGVDLVTLVEGILRSAVMAGVHSVDVSMIIAPAIHEFIKTTADELDVEYEEGFESKEEKKRQMYSRDAVLSADFGKNQKQKFTREKARIEKEEEPSETMMEESNDKPVGLMARRS